VAVAGNARMVIGEELAVTELWDAARRRLPTPREDRPGQPVYVLDEPPEPGDTGVRKATQDDFAGRRLQSGDARPQSGVANSQEAHFTVLAATTSWPGAA